MSEKRFKFGCMRRDRPDFLLQDLVKQADQKRPILSTYAFGVLPRRTSEAANSPTYSVSPNSPTNKLLSSAKYRAKIHPLLLFFAKKVSGTFRCIFRLFSLCLLGFLASVTDLTKGQNNYSPTVLRWRITNAGKTGIRSLPSQLCIVSRTSLP